MFWEQLQQCQTEDDVNHLTARWIAKAFREAEKKKRAWNRKAQARINEIREKTPLSPRRKDEALTIDDILTAQKDLQKGAAPVERNAKGEPIYRLGKP